MHLNSCRGLSELLVVFVFGLLVTHATGQISDTLVQIEPILIEVKNNSPVSNDFLVFSENLTNGSPAFIKNYGPSSIATITYRGGAANQTNISWNGLPVNNPALGVTDFSLLNSFLIDSYILDNNATTLPNVNGELKLESQIDTNSLTLLSTLGSFGLRQHGLKLTKNLGALQIGARLSRMITNNNFPYTIGEQAFVTEHAKYRQNAILLESSYSKSPRFKLNISSWYASTYRQIPRTTRQNISEAVQEDRSLRNVMSILYSNPSWSIKSSLGYTFEEIVYEDRQIDLRSPGEMNSWYFQNSVHKYLDEVTLGLFTMAQYATANSPSLNGQKENVSLSTGMSARMDLDKIWCNGTLSVTSDLSHNAYFPWNFDLGYNLTNYFSATLHLGQQLRWATINDLYWKPGGNPDLKPEKSQNIELGFNYIRGDLSIKIFGYYRDVDDWILWAQDPAGPFFSVQNIARVITKGIELNGQNQVSLSQRFTLKNAINAALNISENQTGIMSPSINPGDQLFYTPKYKFNYTAALQYGACCLRIDPMLVSNTRGLNEAIDGYFLLNSSVEYTFLHKWASVLLRGSVDNLTNTAYRIIEYRPMPGTNFRLSLLFTLS
jgi:iron complex outermembrane receptor protein